jgi:hypothetical protein
MGGVSTALKALTGEFTPPGIYSLAREKSFSLATIKGISIQNYN